MIRWGGAAILGLTPIAVIACLLALGRQDFEHCFNQVSLTFLTALASEAPGLLHPIGFIGLVPFLGLATVWVNRTNRPLTLVLWLALLGLAIAMLWPPSAQHDCDRKGTNGIFVSLLLAFPGIVANWLALWKSKSEVGL